MFDLKKRRRHQGARNEKRGMAAFSNAQDRFYAVPEVFLISGTALLQ
jgi:hypothetical protein